MLGDQAPAARPGRLALTGILTAGMIGGTLTQFVFSALGPVFTTEVGLSPFELGVLVSTYFLVGAACSPLLGRATDRVGGRRALQWTFLLGAISLASLSIAPSLPVMLAGSVAGGLAGALANPATNSLVVTHVPRGAQGVATGLKQSGVPLGALLAGTLLPPVAAVLGWRPALALAAAIVLTGIVASRTLPAADVPTRSEADVAAAGVGRTVRWLAAYAFFMGGGVSAVITYVPLYGFEIFDLSTARAGLLTGIFGAAGIAARILWSRMAEHQVRASSVLVALAGTGMAMQILLVAAPAIGVWALWVSIAVIGSTAGGWNSVVMLVVVRDVPHSVSGRASGTIILAFYAGLMVSPVPFGSAVEHLESYTAGWLVVAAMFAVATICALAWHRGPAARASP